MAGKILVVTPHSTLGELIRHRLEQGGQHQVSVAASSPEAVSLNRSTSHSLAILDGDLTQPALDGLARQLHRQHPAIRILALPPSGSPNRPPFASDTGSPLDASFDELVRHIERLLPAAQVEPPGTHSSPETVSSPRGSQFASLMAPLLAEANAQAAFFCIRGLVAACPEQLPGGVHESITHVLQEYLAQKENGDLVRYLTWTPDPATFLLYATHLPVKNSSEAEAAALLFEGQTPLSRARARVHTFAHSLAGLAEIHETSLREDLRLPDPGLDEASPSGIAAAFETASAWVREVDGSPLGDVHAPDSMAPPKRSAANPGILASENTSGEGRPAGILDSPTVDTLVTPGVPELAWSLPEAVLPSEEGLLPTLAPPMFILETQPQPADPLEPVTTNVYNLAYTGLFIPRLPRHFLTRELADLVGSTFPHICLAYGWRLEALSVRPEYIQWVVRASPSIAPNSLLRVLRQRSSQVIFDTYPLLRQDNPSGDFWAPGYLILSGVHTPSAGLVREYILQTRRRQGILPG